MGCWLMLLKLDYATFQVEASDLPRSNLSDLLTASPLVWREFGNPDNLRSVSEYGVSYWPNCGAPARACRIQFSGLGCTRFFDKLPAIREGVENHLSRVDIAFETFLTKDRWWEIDDIAHALNRQRERDGDEGIRHPKAITYCSSPKDAVTIYIGSRRSPYYFRIYNKTRENPFYRTMDSHGNYIDTPADCYLIRFELEEKRFRRTLRGEKQLYDPSTTFDLYYNDPAGLINHIRDLWQSYCPAELLADIDFNVNNFDFQTKVLFCCVEHDDTRKDNFVAEWPDIACDPVPCGKGLEWVVDRFGSYVPFILNDRRLWQICLHKFMLRWGFDPGLKIVQDDCDDLDGPDFEDWEPLDDAYDVSVFDPAPLAGDQLAVDLPDAVVHPDFYI